ncbi:MAG: PIN domain-containing protein [Rhodospirillales bacterium]|nr:MAG: PIN domain-containing protein [Rhodospirillales bacterium]
MTEFVLDASAILAFLNGEPGGERVRACLSSGACVSSVNLSEVASVLARIGMPVDIAQSILSGLPFEVVDFDSFQAFSAAGLSPLTRPSGLSLGDRACLALARLRNAPALTTDRAWSDLNLGIKVEVIR